MEGAGHADLRNLIANEAKVTVAGVGSVYVHPRDSLDATMNGIGAILYSGSPRDVNTRMNGLGTISKHDLREARRWDGRWDGRWGRRDDDDRTDERRDDQWKSLRSLRSIRIRCSPSEKTRKSLRSRRRQCDEQSSLDDEQWSGRILGCPEVSNDSIEQGQQDLCPQQS